MTPREWGIIAAFVATVWVVSIFSPEAALMLAGIVTVAAFVDSGAAQRIVGGTSAASGGGSANG